MAEHAVYNYFYASGRFNRMTKTNKNFGMSQQEGGKRASCCTCCTYTDSDMDLSRMPCTTRRAVVAEQLCAYSDYTSHTDIADGFSHKFVRSPAHTIVVSVVECFILSDLVGSTLST